MSSNTNKQSICKEYSSELDNLILSVKKSLISSPGNDNNIKELLHEIDELLHSLKMENASATIINAYEKEIKEIKSHVSSITVDKPSKPQSIDRIQTLKDSRQTLYETENIGTTILDNLSTQAEKITSLGEKTKDINANMAHSSKLTTKMSSWYHGLFK